MGSDRAGATVVHGELGLSRIETGQQQRVSVWNHREEGLDSKGRRIDEGSLVPQGRLDGDATRDEKTKGGTDLKH